MRIRNTSASEPLHPELEQALAEFRARRRFDAESWIEAKAQLLNAYLKNAGLNAVIVAVSGGIDSAVVLGLAAHAAKAQGSPLQRIVALLLPVFGTEGATNQDKATQRGEETCRAFGIEPSVLHLDESHSVLAAATGKSLGLKGREWADGQLVSYIRTPAIYYTSSLLAENNYKAIVLGTTNLSEGGYLGYFGKASDGMTDVQLVSDAFKSEMHAAGKTLGVPASVMDALPTGDMFDASTDEEVFGASYDFVELHHHWLRLGEERKSAFLDELTLAARSQFTALAANLDAMHRYNKHKYLGRSPAIHLDIMDAAIPGGWDNRPDGEKNDLHKKVPSEEERQKFVAPFLRKDSMAVISEERNVPFHAVRHDLPGGNVVEIPGFLSGQETEKLISLTDGETWAPANNGGYALAGDRKDGVEAGSWRASLYDGAIAAALWRRIQFNLPSFQAEGERTAFESGEHPVWRPCGINPLLRYVRYKDGGFLLPHYDAPFRLTETRRTLMSLVLYLKAGAQGGATRFLRDSQAGVPAHLRCLDDKTEPAPVTDTLLKIRHEAGKAVLFDHRLLHDGETASGEDKIIIRTDIFFERCDWWQDEKNVH